MHIDINEKSSPRLPYSDSGTDFFIDIPSDGIRLFLWIVICFDSPQETESLEPDFPVLPI